MFSRLWLINALMLLCATFFGLKAFAVWSEGESPVLETGNAENRQVQTVKIPVQGITKREVPPESTYEVVMEKNLFSPKRIEPKPETGKQDAKNVGGESPTQKQLEVVLKGISLFGVVITDDYAAALVTDIGNMPSSSKGRRLPKRMLGTNKMKWVKVGDTLGDFEVAGITDDRVLLKAESIKYDLLLYDKDKPKIRASVKPKSKPAVVSTAGKDLATVGKTPKKGVFPARDREEAVSTGKLPRRPQTKIPRSKTGPRWPPKSPN